MKVVINACYGGFGLSPDGEIAYLARKGKTAFFYENVKANGHYDFKNYERVEPSEIQFLAHTLTEDLGPQVTSEQLNASEAWFSVYDLKRNDPDLVAVVEELGVKADGRHAKLEIVEIPDGVEWVVEEYDGLEHVAEAHRTWA